MKVYSKNCSTAFMFFATLTAVGCVLYALAAHWTHHTFFLYNPDIVGDVYVLHTLIYEHDQIQNWALTNVFFLFPDITILFFISLFVKPASYIFPIYAFIQITLTLLFTQYLFRGLIDNRKAAFRVGLIAILSLITVIININPFFEYSYFDYILPVLLPSFHFGSCLIAILCFALTLRILKDMKLWRLLLLSLLVIITGVSDPLLHYYFTVPVMAGIVMWCLMGEITFKKGCYLIAWFMLMLVAWFGIYNYVSFPFSKISLHLTFPLAHLNNLIDTAKFFLSVRSGLLMGCAWAVFVIFAPVSLVISFMRNDLKLLDFFLLFELLMIVLSALAILTTIVPFTKYENVLPLRYFISFILTPVFLGIPALAYKHLNGPQLLKNNYFYFIILALIGFLSLHHKESLHWKKPMLYRPDAVICFDKVIQKYGLNNGLTTNWGYQNTFNAYNQTGTNLILLDMQTLTPRLWFSTRLLYTFKNFDYILLIKSPGPLFNKEKGLMEAHFGKSTTVAVCSDVNSSVKEYIYIYKNNPRLNNLSFEKYYRKQ